MESYEVELPNGKTFPIKAIRGLTGHDILRYKIHGSKQVPFVTTETSQRMEEGDVFAMETFGSTGSSRIRDDPARGVYGYGRDQEANTSGVRLASAKTLLKTIDANIGTLVFSRRYLEHLGVKSYHLGMKSLIEQAIVHSYDPLVDATGSHVAQFEHVSTESCFPASGQLLTTQRSNRPSYSNQARKRSSLEATITDESNNARVALCNPILCRV